MPVEAPIRGAHRAGNASCWACAAPLDAGPHFCASCGKVQPPQPGDYFLLFGLPRKLQIDLPALEREFYRLSRRLHPDVYARASEREQEWSTERSSELNDAYRTLRDPIARTEYLLKLEGVQLEEQSKAATDRARQTGEEKKQVVPPDMLEEVFELNMQLEEMRMARQAGERDQAAEQSLRQAQQSFEARLLGLGSELENYAAEWDAAYERAGNELPPDETRAPIRLKMIDLLNRRSYIRNLVRDVKAALGD